MSTFVSMFAQGSCVLNVYTSNSSIASWSGALGLGQSSPTFSGSEGASWMVAVDGSGNVTLNIDSGSASSGFAGHVDVLPQYDVSAAQTQASALNSLYAGSYGGGIALDDATSVDLTFDAVTGVATPPLVTFDAHAPASGEPTLVGLLTNGAS